MLISLNELNRWVDTSSLSADELSDKLTMLGLEVEGSKVIGGQIDGIVVGCIDSIDEHPKSTKLVICTVNVGQEKPLTIVCGAKNMAAGDYVPVAMSGSQPPAIDFQIVTREVAGVTSEGMLCAEEELGLANKSDGLMILSSEYKIGLPIFEALELNDIQLDIGLTPNRPDCLSHRGVARECAAFLNKELIATSLEAPKSSGTKTSDLASLDIQDLEGCPRYAFAIIENVNVGESPWWLKRRLIQMGQRSINNIVDITNLISCDLGQPLHAFDLDKIEGDSIVVRRAQKDEEFKAIDHKTYTLNEDDLVIADTQKAIAIAGVMGGSETEVDENTTRILIECAYFNPTSVRKSAKRLGLHTESSHRYERGIDISAIKENLEAALQLMMKTQDHAKRSDGIVEAYPEVQIPNVVSIDKKLIQRILGIDLEHAEIAALLNSIGFKTQEKEKVEVTVPLFRPDVERPIDLVEEVARLHGFDKFIATSPKLSVGDHQRKLEPKHGPTIVSKNEQEHIQWIREHLLSSGFYEAISFSFMPKQALEQLDLAEDDFRRNTVELTNPMTEDHACMRTTLAFGLLEACQLNFAQRAKDFGFFEIGRTYHPEHEEYKVSLVVTGKKVEHFSADVKWDFFDVKALILSLNARFNIEGCEWKVSDASGFLHPGVQAAGVIDGEEFITIGQIHPLVASSFGTDQPIFYAEIDLRFLSSRIRSTKPFSDFCKFPSMKRDMAIVLSEDKKFGDLEKSVFNFANSDEKFQMLFKGIHLFDIYRGEQVKSNHMSYAISIEYRADDQTLTDEIVGDLDNRLMKYLSSELNAERR